MRELRFHRELYRGESVDEAIRTFEPYATIERSAEPSHWVVRVACATEARERRVADELANYALGKTLESRGAFS